jgi:hypothetical protein
MIAVSLPAQGVNEPRRKVQWSFPARRMPCQEQGWTLSRMEPPGFWTTSEGVQQIALPVRDGPGQMVDEPVRPEGLEALERTGWLGAVARLSIPCVVKDLGPTACHALR